MEVTLPSCRIQQVVSECIRNLPERFNNFASMLDRGITKITTWILLHREKTISNRRFRWSSVWNTKCSSFGFCICTYIFIKTASIYKNYIFLCTRYFQKLTRYSPTTWPTSKSSTNLSTRSPWEFRHRSSMKKPSTNQLKK